MAELAAQPAAQAPPTPVLVFTGFLGAGKTTVILNLLQQLPPGSRPALLKNEFGDLAVDSLLLQESPNVAVQEMVNGCLCCVLVGQMKNALEEMRAKFCPDLIIVETSGSAFPAPIAWQIREMDAREFKLDAIVTVVDAVNFAGYEDTSVTAKLQAQYTDLIILNKAELVSERQLDLVLDHVNELNTDTAKVVADRGRVALDLVLGTHTTLFSSRGDALLHAPDHHQREVDIVQMTATSAGVLENEATLAAYLMALPASEIYRCKGLVVLQCDPTAVWLVNYAFGRFDIVPLRKQSPGALALQLTFMGQDLRRLHKSIGDRLRATDLTLKTYFRA